MKDLAKAPNGRERELILKQGRVRGWAGMLNGHLGRKALFLQAAAVVDQEDSSGKGGGENCSAHTYVQCKLPQPDKGTVMLFPPSFQLREGPDK